MDRNTRRYKSYSAGGLLSGGTLGDVTAGKRKRHKRIGHRVSKPVKHVYPTAGMPRMYLNPDWGAHDLRERIRRLVEENFKKRQPKSAGAGKLVVVRGAKQKDVLLANLIINVIEDLTRKGAKVTPLADIIPLVMRECKKSASGAYFGESSISEMVRFLQEQGVIRSEPYRG